MSYMSMWPYVGSIPIVQPWTILLGLDGSVGPKINEIHINEKKIKNKKNPTPKVISWLH